MKQIEIISLKQKCLEQALSLRVGIKGEYVYLCNKIEDYGDSGNSLLLVCF